MNHHLNDPRHPWARLTAAARDVRDDRDASVPYGFATRLAALAFAQEGKAVSLFDLFALRAVGIASLLALFSVAWNYNALTEPSRNVATVASVDEVLLPTTDAVAVMLDIAD